MMKKNNKFENEYDLDLKKLLKLVKTKGILVKTMEKGTPFISVIREEYKKALGAVPVKNLFGNITNVYLVYEDMEGLIKYYDYPQFSQRELDVKRKNTNITEKYIKLIKDYAAGRASDVKRGAETPWLAATLLQKYGTGIVDAVICFYDDNRAADKIKNVLDEEVVKIDHNWVEHMRERWDGCPADIIVKKTPVAIDDIFKKDTKDMSFDELKEQIENYKGTLKEYLRGTDNYNSLSKQLFAAEKEMMWRRGKIREQIIKDIADPDTMSIEEANYVSYLEFLSDAQMGDHGYEDVLFEEFSEEELERLWRESHK
jgi:hypothetical protein